MEFLDSAIPDRILAIKGTTKVFSRNSPEEWPPHYHGNMKDWKNGPERFGEDGLFWVMKDPDCTKKAESFMKEEEEGGFRNELGCLLVLLGYWSYHVLQKPENGGEIPIPDIILKDQKDFLREADHVGQYLADNCQVGDKYGKTQFKNVWLDYKTWCLEQAMKQPEQKNFKASLRSKGLICFEKIKKASKTGHISNHGKQFVVKLALNANLDFVIADSTKE